MSATLMGHMVLWGAKPHDSGRQSLLLLFYLSDSRRVYAQNWTNW